MGRIKPAALLLQSKKKKSPTRLSVTTIYACNVVIILFLLSVAFIHKQVGSNQNGYYKGLVFHRVVKGFMFQGDNSGENGTKELSGWDGSIKKHFGSSFKYGPLKLSMAKVQSDTNGSQFYITTIRTPQLSVGNTIFGRVVHGQEVLEDIENSPTNSNDEPLTDVVIRSIEFKDSII